MDVLIARDKKGGTAILTVNSPVSHYGIPVLRIEAEDVEGDFGPSDLIGKDNNLITAAQVVAGWVTSGEHTAEELALAQLFLGQWPEGPQIAGAEREGEL